MDSGRDDQRPPPQGFYERTWVHRSDQRNHNVCTNHIGCPRIRHPSQMVTTSSVRLQIDVENVNVVHRGMFAAQTLGNNWKMDASSRSRAALWSCFPTYRRFSSQNVRGKTNRKSGLARPTAFEVGR